MYHRALLFHKSRELCPLSAVEPPEVIDSHELRYPDSTYHVRNLDATEPILKQREDKSPSPAKTARKKGESVEKAAKNRQKFSTTGDFLSSSILYKSSPTDL